MRRLPVWPLLATLSLAPLPGAEEPRLTAEGRMELIRGLTAEYVTVKIPLPRSKKPLILESTGSFDQESWDEAGKQSGLAAKPGAQVTITKVTIEDKRILLEINGGLKSGRKWYERIEIGTSSRTTPVSRGSGAGPTTGTNLALAFPRRVPPLKAADVKKLLAPVLDFNVRSAAEQYVESLPPPIQKAIKEKRAVEGMDQDQVILAMGRPDRKTREMVDGVEVEDWIYGKPPGRIVFVTFEGEKVIRVKEAYAGIGGSVAPPLPPPR